MPSRLYYNSYLEVGIAILLYYTCMYNNANVVTYGGGGGALYKLSKVSSKSYLVPNCRLKPRIETFFHLTSHPLHTTLREKKLLLK